VTALNGRMASPSATAARPSHGLGCRGCNHVSKFLPPSFFC